MRWIRDCFLEQAHPFVLHSGVVTALVIFLVTCLFIGLRRIPRLHINRPASALLGAVLMIVAGVLNLDQLRPALAADAVTAEKEWLPRIVTVTPADHATTPRDYRVVLLCDTSASRERGLQGFRRLQGDEAALFVFPNPEAVTFWMGSVAFPIDIVFIGPDKKVVRVYPDCRPRSREYYPSTAPVRWVIETAAGSGIRAGDSVSFRGNQE